MAGQESCVMRRVAILASVLAAAIGSAKCSQSPSASILAPSSVEAGTAATAAKGGAGGGGGKPGGGGGTTGGGSLAVVMLDDKNGNNAPNYGDTITFNVSTSATSPFVQVDCYQGTLWVYTGSVGYFDAYPWVKQFTLTSSYWAGGSASCKAQLYTSKDGTSMNVLSTLNFEAGA
jgi:hypothetical protein